MARCEMGYELQDDLVPPQRCHCYNGDFGSYESCKDCHNYYEEDDLINHAIEYAKNQKEIMDVMIKALEFYRDEMYD